MVNEFPRKHDSGLTEQKTINPVTVKGPSVLVNCRQLICIKDLYDADTLYFYMRNSPIQLSRVINTNKKIKYQKKQIP